MAVEFFEFSGKAIMGDHRRKCQGVNGLNSWGFSDIADKSREFKMASICVSKVVNSSNVKLWFAAAFLRCVFMFLTAASHMVG